MTGVLVKRENFKHTHTGPHHVEMKADMGWGRYEQRDTEDGPQMTKSRRDTWNRFSATALRTSLAHPLILNF